MVTPPSGGLFVPDTYIVTHPHYGVNSDQMKMFIFDQALTVFKNKLAGIPSASDLITGINKTEKEA